MKNIIIIVLLITTLYSQNNMAAIGGVNYSTFVNSDEVIYGNAKEIIGYRIGIEKNSNGLITGITYSQRGTSFEYDYYYNDGYVYGYTSYNDKITLNYLTGYILARVPLLSGLSLLAGGEIGYFIEGEISAEWEFEGSIESYRDSYTYTFDRDEWLDEMWGNDIDYGIVLGAQFNLSPKIAVAGTYYMGLVDIFKERDGPNTEMGKHSGLQIYLSYGL